MFQEKISLRFPAYRSPGVLSVRVVVRESERFDERFRYSSPYVPEDGARAIGEFVGAEDAGARHFFEGGRFDELGDFAFRYVFFGREKRAVGPDPKFDLAIARKFEVGLEGARILIEIPFDARDVAEGCLYVGTNDFRYGIRREVFGRYV